MPTIERIKDARRRGNANIMEAIVTKSGKPIEKNPPVSPQRKQKTNPSKRLIHPALIGLRFVFSFSLIISCPNVKAARPDTGGAVTNAD